MSAEDWVYDYGDAEDDEITCDRCDRCGEEYLHWSYIFPGRWILTDDNGDPHRCPPAEADDFEVIQ